MKRAAGYLLKDADAADVAAAIRSAVAGEVHLAPSVARALTASLRAPRHEQASLTPREREVIVAVASGARLARELHDSVSQALFAMTLHARTAQRYLGSAGLPDDHPVAIEVEQLHSLTQAALAEMRALIFELRPGALEAEGLVAALTKQGAAISAREGLSVHVHGPEHSLGLDPAVEEHLYRIALEALNNIVRHAGATRVEVELQHTGAVLVLRVRDDGSGFDPEMARPGHLGLSTMRERAEVIGATFASESGPGRGCEVAVVLPFTA